MIQITPQRSLRSVAALLITLSGIGAVVAQARPSMFAGKMRSGAIRPLNGVVDKPFTWFQGPNDTPGYSLEVAFDAEGNPIAVGAQEVDGIETFAVVKYRRDGTVFWAHHVETGSGPGQATSVVVDPTGAIIAGGFVTIDVGTTAPGGRSPARRRSLSPGRKTARTAEPGMISRDWCLVKLTPGGSVEWLFAVDFAAMDDELNDLALDSDGNILAAGSIGNPSSGLDFATVSFDPTTGVPQWTSQLDGGALGTDYAASVSAGPPIAEGARDSVYVTGKMDLILGGAEECTQGIAPSMATVRLDGDTGNTFWRRNENQNVDATSEQGKKILTLPSGDAVVAGTIAGGPAGEARYYVARYAALDAATVWIFATAGSLGDSRNCATALAFDPVAGLYAGGSIASMDTGGDALVQQLDPDTGTENWSILHAGQTEELTHALAARGSKIAAAQSVDSGTGFENDFRTLLIAPDSTVRSSFRRPALADVFDEALSVAIAPNGDLLTGGFTSRMDETIDFSVGFVDCAGPNLTDCTVSPRRLPSFGGPASLSVVATDEFGVAGVQGRLTDAGGGTTFVTLANMSGAWTGTFNAPGNDSAMDAVYTVDFLGTDSTGNTTVLNCGTLAVALKDVILPIINSCDITPRKLGNLGGIVNASANVTDNEFVDHVKVIVTAPDETTQFQNLALTDPDIYSGSFTLPANPGPDPMDYAMTIAAVDGRGNTATLACGKVTVCPPDITPPVIQSCNSTPPSIPQPGAPVTVQATVTDDQGVGPVTAKALDGDGGMVMTTLAPVGGNDFEGTLNIPANPRIGPIVWDVTLEARDLAGNAATGDCPDVMVQGTDTVPPAIANCVVAPTTLPGIGGDVDVTADVTDANGLALVQVEIGDGKKALQTVPMILQGVGPQYRATVTLPANESATPMTYTVTIIAEDNAGNISTQGCDNVLVLEHDKQSPSLLLPVTNPTELPAEGGTVQFQICVFDNQGVGAARVYVGPPTGGVAPRGFVVQPVTVPLTQIGPDLYAGEYAAPPNSGASPVVYPVFFEAEDLSGNGAGMQGASFAVLPPPTGKGALTVTRRLLDFGLVLVKHTGRMTFGVRNTGDAPVTFHFSTLTGPFSVMEKKGRTLVPVAYPYGGYTLKPAQKLTFVVEFTPLEHARYKDTLLLLPGMGSKGPARSPSEALAQVELRGLGCRRIRR